MDNITYDDKAKIMYEKHLERMRNYSKNNREKTRDTAKKVYQKIKEDPEKYKLYLERRRNEYHARKQKKLLKSKDLIYKKGYLYIPINKIYIMNEILIKLF